MVIDAMKHAIYAFDVQHIIIDNLQFMTADQGRFQDRWELQERTVGTFRKFASDRNVHITLVVHPRKDDRSALDLNSIFGSAKVTQEADNVIILQRYLKSDGEELRYLDFKKNRLVRILHMSFRERVKPRYCCTLGMTVSWAQLITNSIAQHAG
jgi:twinkle protein